MDRPATKQDLLAIISDGLAGAEFAIRNHPVETVSIYETGKAALLFQHATTEHTDWSRQSGFSLDELSLVHRYLAAFAFISAWHDIHGQADARNKASASPCLLVSSLMECPPEHTLHEYLKYERLWRAVLKPRRWWQFWRRV